MSDKTYAFPRVRMEPLNDASHVRNAIARFDQVRDVPATGEDAQETQLAAVNRRGRNIAIRVVCTALAGEPDSVSGAIILMEDERDG